MAHVSERLTSLDDRSLIALEAFNDAAAAVSSRTKDWHFSAVFYSLALAAALSFFIPFQLLKGGAGIWWQLLIAPSCVMCFGTPLLLRVMRREDVLTESESLLNCPHCEEQLAHSAIRTCGCCLECGMQIVTLPERGDGELRDRDQVASEWVRSGRLLGRWAFGPLVLIFGGGCVVATIQQSFAPLEFATVASVVAFFGGLGVVAFLDRETEPVKCSGCETNLSNSPQSRSWLMATCRCPRCGQVALASDIIQVADTLLDATSIRDIIKYRWSRYTRSVITVSAAVPTMLISTTVARMNGVDRDTAVSWVFAFTFPVMLWAVWHGVFSQFFNAVDRCQLCDGDISSSLPVVATTGRCPTCAGVICDAGS